VTIDVLANDSDADGDSLSVSAVAQGSNGSVATNGATVTYTPTAGFSGSDVFTYTASDGQGGTDTATVTVTVTFVNTPPTAVDDSATTPEDTAVTVNVLANDSDADGDSLSVSAVAQGANGSVATNGTTVTYTPTADFNGSDVFTYTASDGQGGTDTATVTVTVGTPCPEPGDTNGDCTVNAGDISALVLEIFDGDGDAPGGAPGGSFPGTHGCDANEDNRCDAGDISCTILIIFNGEGACGGSGTSASVSQAAPTLSLPELVTTAGESRVRVPLSYAGNGHSISSLAFSIDYDESWLSLEGSDAVLLDLPAAFSGSADISVSRTAGEVNIAIFDAAAPLEALPSGTLGTLTFSLAAPPTAAEAAVEFSAGQAASFGTTTGESVAGVVDGGVVRISPTDGQPEQVERQIFLPSIAP
jgi:hypothetical protein